MDPSSFEREVRGFRCSGVVSKAFAVDQQQRRHEIPAQQPAVQRASRLVEDTESRASFAEAELSDDSLGGSSCNSEDEAECERLAAQVPACIEGSEEDRKLVAM